MSKPQRSKHGSKGPSAGFSMRFTAHHSSNDESSDADTVTTEPDGVRASSAKPPRPAVPPSRGAGTTVTTSTAGEAISQSTEAPGESKEEDWEFVIPEDTVGMMDHFASGVNKPTLPKSSSQQSFYSHPKSEGANQQHDLSSPPPSVHGGDPPVSAKEVRWKRKRSLMPPSESVADDEDAVTTRHPWTRPGNLMLMATVAMLFVQFNTSAFLTGSALGAIIVFYIGLLVVYNVTREVPHYNDDIIDFEELHAAMVSRQGATTGDGISLMQPKTILKDCFSVVQDYSGPTTFRPSTASKVRLRLCGSQLRVSRLSVREGLSLLDMNQEIPDSCSDGSDSEDSAAESAEAFGLPRRRRRKSKSSTVTILSSKSYSVLGSKVSLAPEGLNQRQRWSKKLPLHLVIDPDAQFSSQEDIPSAVEDSDRGGAARPSEPLQFYLFAGTGRIKQDWYMRLKLAADPSLVSKDLASISSYHDQYAKYMDFLLIHLHPARASRYNLLRNDAIVTSRSITELVEQTARQNSLSSFELVSNFSASSASLTSTASAPATMTATSREEHGSVSLGSASLPPKPAPGIRPQQSNKPGGGIVPDPRHSLRSGSLLWFNAALGRLLYDAWREPRWAEKLRVRWQRKLSRMKRPIYISQLNMTDLHLGSSIPIIKKFGKPRIDSRGLWIDVGVSYKGTFKLTIETAVNLNPFIEEQTAAAPAPSAPPLPPSSMSSTAASPGGTKLSAVASDEDMVTVSMADIENLDQDVDDGDDDGLSTDSDMDSGADEDEADATDPSGAQAASASATALATATSMLQSLEKSFPSLSTTISQVTGLTATTDQAPPALPAVATPPAPGTSPAGATSKLKRFAGYVAHTRLGQNIMKSNVVKKLSEKVSNMPLVLSVELKQLSGTMTINFPPPPSAVVWFSFAKMPDMILIAKPRVGQREVKVNHVTDWIEKKLKAELKKRLVMPNMEDLALPLMSGGAEEMVESSAPDAANKRTQEHT